MIVIDSELFESVIQICFLSYSSISLSLYDYFIKRQKYPAILDVRTNTVHCFICMRIMNRIFLIQYHFRTDEQFIRFGLELHEATAFVIQIIGTADELKSIKSVADSENSKKRTISSASIYRIQTVLYTVSKRKDSRKSQSCSEHINGIHNNIVKCDLHTLFS